MKLIVALLIVLILGMCTTLLLMLRSRNEYDDKQSDEDQMKYLDEWYRIYRKR